MALSTAPVAAGRPGPSLTLLRDRKPDRRTEVADLTDDLTAHHLEAVELVDGLLPLVALLTNAAREVSPAHYQAALTVAYRLRRYRTQNESPDPDSAVAA